MLIQCNYCGREFNQKPYKLKAENYCDRFCWSMSKWACKPCVVCGGMVVRLKCAMLAEVCCGKECTKTYLGGRFSRMNEELNPDRMRPETKAKLREANLGKGEGRAYTKTFGRHTHRIVAEQKLGRQLKPGEVVHHINENRLDNRPENLMVFTSQAEHARWHAEVNYLLYGIPLCNSSQKDTK